MHRLNRCWTLPEHLWVHMNANEWVGIAPEHPLSVHECKWVNGNSPWTPIEWTQLPMSEMDAHWTPIECAQTLMIKCEHLWVCVKGIESWLNVTHHGETMRKIAFLSELNTAWMLVTAHECLWVSIEHALNACECMWTPLSEYWTNPEHLWVCMNASVQVGTFPEHPLSVHECLWVSISKVWMQTSRVVNSKNV
jgi:hypothetical protein